MRRHLVTLGRCAVLFVVLGAAVGLLGAAPVRGAPSAAEWERTGLTEPTRALLTPASGAFLAQTASGLARSDDGGATWRSVSLPPGFPIDRYRPGDRWRHGVVAVDPNDHSRLFVGAWVSRDDAATWSPLGPWADNGDADVFPLPSGADPSLLYLAVKTGVMGGSGATMLRSRDGGESWDAVLKLSSSDFRPSSGVAVTLFEAHPSDPSILFQSVVGFRGSGNQGILRRSTDQGATFDEVLASSLRYPVRLVGGRGDAPGRLYVALQGEETSSALFRSDDNGATWVGAATFPPGRPDTRPALTYDPAAPDRVWIGLDGGGVKASEDGGQTWTDLSPTAWSVNAIALGIDGANLYAGTTDGVFRLPLR